MNTPAHVIFSFAGLGRTNAVVYTVPIAIGALVPDMTMMLFYAAMKIGGVPEAEIWNQHYFDPLWQGIFDMTNSIPVYAALAVAGWVVSRKALALFAASAIIHCVLDLLVHNDDGHRHFFRFPISDSTARCHTGIRPTTAILSVSWKYCWSLRCPCGCGLVRSRQSTATKDDIRGPYLQFALQY